jgi:thiol-disulfide isomerase/thioredoxin
MKKWRENNMDKKLVLFFSKTCQPCSMMRPLIQKISKETGITLKEIETDNSKGSEHAQKYNINSWPTILIVKDGVIADVIVGYNTGQDEEINKKDLIQKINAVFS